MIDLTKLSDDEFFGFLEKVLDERDRRQRLASIPKQVTALAIAFMSDGGKKDIIQEAVTSAALPEQVTENVTNIATFTDQPGP